MALLNLDQKTQLRQNWQATQDAEATGTQIDVVPVVKLFTPWASGTWLLTEIKPGDGGIAFGLCDLGHGCPEIGYVSLAEIVALSGPGGLRVERDEHFKAKASLAVYARAAHIAGNITNDRQALEDAHDWLIEDAKREQTTSIGFLVCGSREV